MINLPAHVRGSLIRLAESSDRASPTVFAGREDEFRLLDAAARGARRGEPGHTVVIHGVPGAGKTALLNEYAARLLESDSHTEKPTIPVPLRPSDLDDSPVAILQEIDRQFREFETSDLWRARLNRAAGGASLLGNALFAFHGPSSDARREQWIDTATATILAESGSFPHHLANGCRALAEIVLDEGIGEAPPVERLRERCRRLPTSSGP